MRDGLSLKETFELGIVWVRGPGHLPSTLIHRIARKVNPGKSTFTILYSLGPSDQAGRPSPGPRH